MRSAEAPKGKNKRCGDQVWVGGVPTLPGEHAFVLVNGVPTRVRSRAQLPDDPARVVVAPAGTRVTANMFTPDSDLPERCWAGHTSRSLARGGQARRRTGQAVARSTLTGHPELAARLGRPPRVSVRPVLDLGADPEITDATSRFVTEVRSRGGRALVVGGAPRDMILARMRGGRPAVKDVDLEVYGLAGGEVQALTEAMFANVDLAGASKGVLKVSREGDGPVDLLDIALPRTEKSTGTSHTSFDVDTDPFLDFATAASRRDFTVGAMGFDPLTGELLDPYGGAADLAAGVLRHVSPAFEEDPLRPMRAARFVARFGFSVHPDTVEVCRQIRPKGADLPAERLWGELTATFQQATTPGDFFRTLDQIDWIDIYPQVASLRGVQQDPGWHPEGDVFVHTAHALDYWSQHLRSGNVDDDLIVALATLCHDLGKAETTTWDGERWRAIGHEDAGAEPTKAMLSALRQDVKADIVAPYVRDHLAPAKFYKETIGRSPDSMDKAVRRLSTRVDRLDLLARVFVADAGGRPPLEPVEAVKASEWLLDRAAALEVTRGAPKPLGTGRHLIAAGMKPGPQFKPLLDQVYEEQLDGLIVDEDGARRRLLELVATAQPST